MRNVNGSQYSVAGRRYRCVWLSLPGIRKEGREGGSKVHKYEELRVYQRALDLAACVYELTSKWPPEERFGLVGQMRRAATSIVLNIAEGAGAGTNPEFIRFLRYSIRSKYELAAGFDIATRVGFSGADSLVEPRSIAEEVASMLIGLSRSLETSQ